MFCKQLTGNNKLPPTLGVFEEHINRACAILKSRIMSTIKPLFLNSNLLILFNTPIAAHRYSCRRNNLTGTELSSCDTEWENDEDCNTGNEDSDNDEVQLVGFSKNAHFYFYLVTI